MYGCKPVFSQYLLEVWSLLLLLSLKYNQKCHCSTTLECNLKYWKNDFLSLFQNMFFIPIKSSADYHFLCNTCWDSTSDLYFQHQNSFFPINYVKLPKNFFVLELFLLGQKKSFRKSARLTFFSHSPTDIVEYGSEYIFLIKKTRRQIAKVRKDNICGKSTDIPWCRLRIRSMYF